MTAKATATPNTAMTKTATTTTTATTTGSGWVGALQAGWYDRLASDRENASVSAAATASPASDNAMPAGLLVVRPPTGLLVVQQRRIYAAHMVATSSEPTQFKTLHASALNFQPQVARVNRTGQLMAVAGERRVAIVVLPAAAHLKSGGWEEMTVTTIKVGEYHHSTDTQHTVVDVQWHPLSKDQTHLVVLSSDGCLRTYNLATNPKDPESAYHFNPELATAALAERKERRMSSSLSSLTSSLSLTPRKRNTGTFGVDSTMELEASAFCFGRDDGAWGRLTIWGLMTNGEVYTLCPVLPSHALVPKDMLAGLYRTTGSSVDSSFDNDGDDDDLQSPSRMAFLDMLESRGSPLTPKSALLSIAHQPALLDAPFPRGPYRAESALQQEIQDMDDTFTDVAMLGRDGLDVLAVASSNGVVDLYGVFEQMPCWSAAPVAERAVGHKPASAGFMDDSLEEDSFAAELMDSVETGPMLTAFESIDLGRETGNTRLYIGSADDGENATIIYAHHDAGVHAIDASSWMSELSKILGEEGTTNKDLNQRIEQMFPVDENQSGGLWSDVQGIIDTMPYESSSPSPVVSLAQVRDPILGSHFLALLHTGHLLFQDQTQFHIQTQVTKSTEDGARLADQLALASSDIDPALLTSILAEQPIDEVLPFIKTSASGGVHISYPIANTGRIVTGQVQPKSSVAGAAAEIMHYPSGVDKDTVEQLHAFTAKLRDSVKTVLCYLVAARARKDCFESEAKRADDLLTYVERTVSHDSETGTVAIQSRVDTCVKNMERLTKRVDVLLQICMETYSPGLSEYEIKWAEELERMKKQVHTFVGQTQKLKNQMALLHRDYEISISNSDTAAGANTVGQHQLRQLSRLVEQESRFIEEIRLRLRDVELKLDVIEE